MNKYQENIISSVNQNERDDFLYRGEGSKLRILFVGNSITLHGKLPEAGWNQDCGMAASCLEKDYVHVLISKIKEKYDPNVTFSILQVANYERRFLEVTPAELYGEEVAEATTIQYGGSMNDANAAELLAKVNVDGGLIGGASLKTDKFTTIVKAANA